MTFYEQLGVDRNATDEEIKRAYFRLVRQYPPETDPDSFMRIRAAYEELSDKDKRAEYDIQIAIYDDIPDEVKEPIMEAELQFTKGLATDAVEMLEQKLLEHKGDDASALAIKYSLAIMYMEMEKSGKAVDLAEKLVVADPNNIKYLRLAVNACLNRGWSKKAFAYLVDLMQIDPGNEDNIVSLIENMDYSPFDIGMLVEHIESCGRNAPMLCGYILTHNLMSPDLESDDSEQYEQMDLFADTDPESYHANQPWDDPVFAAAKMAEHTSDISDQKRELLALLLRIGIIHGMYYTDRYDILPQIDKIIRNIGAEELFQSSEYTAVSIGYAALEAVRAGIPKTLAALPFIRAYSLSEQLGEIDKREYRDEAIALELDILLSYNSLKPDIKRFHDEFGTLYQHSAGFLDAITRYNESRLQDEINKRIAKLKHLDTRLTLDWLGEDDGFYNATGETDDAEYAPKTEPVRVVKIGRNEPCPCGSGLKYKKCCGR